MVRIETRDVVSNKNLDKLSFKLNEELKSIGTPEYLLKDMPIHMKKDILKNCTKFYRGDILDNLNENNTDKNFHGYTVIYNPFSTTVKDGKLIYFYYKWDNPSYILLKCDENLKISWSDNYRGIPNSWNKHFEIHSNNDKFDKVVDDSNIMNIAPMNTEWNSYINFLDVIGVKRMKYIDGYKKITLKKIKSSNTDSILNINYTHDAGVKYNFRSFLN